MSLETIALIILLTLLAVSLGTDILWFMVIQPACFNFFNILMGERYTSDSAKLYLEVIKNIYCQTINIIKFISIVVVIWAIILNIVPNLRIESYLLQIGLVSLVIYIVLFFADFITKNNEIQLILEQDNFDAVAQIKSNWNIIIWVRLLCILVAYWSFLHYALNPRK